MDISIAIRHSGVMRNIASAETPADAHDTNDVITELEVSILLRVSRATLRVWRTRKKGPPFIRLHDRCPRYLRSQVIAWLQTRMVPPAP